MNNKQPRFGGPYAEQYERLWAESRVRSLTPLDVFTMIGDVARLFPAIEALRKEVVILKGRRKPSRARKRLPAKAGMTEKDKLEMIPGIGPVLAERLLRSFGSISSIRQASIEQLDLVKGISKRLAKQIKEYLR